jgi:hypothetical protein
LDAAPFTELVSLGRVPQHDAHLVHAVYHGNRAGRSGIDRPRATLLRLGTQDLLWAVPALIALVAIRWLFQPVLGSED